MSKRDRKNLKLASDALAATPANMRPVPTPDASDTQSASDTQGDTQGTIGVKRVYTFQRHRTSADGYTHQLGACAHAAFTSPGKGVVYVPLHMLAVPPVSGDTLALGVSAVPVEGHTLSYCGITGNDARRRYSVAGHSGRVVIHAEQLPQGATDPHMYLWCSLALALPNVPRVTLARDTVAIVADAAMRIAVAAGRTMPTDDDVTTAKHAIGV